MSTWRESNSNCLELENAACAPRVQMRAISKGAIWEEGGEDVEECFDKSISICSSDKWIVWEDEFSKSDEEREGGHKNSSNFKKAKKVKTEDRKEKHLEEKKEVTEQEKTKEDKQETKGLDTQVITKWGQGPEWVCLRMAGSMWVLNLMQKRFRKFSDFGNTFITARDSEMKEGFRIEEVMGDSNVRKILV